MTPWIEHTKWFPRYEFLIWMKGQEFVDDIQARYPHLLEQLLSTSDTPEEENADPPVVHFSPGESSEDVVTLSMPMVKAALEMGFSRSLVRQTAQHQILVRQTAQHQILATAESYRTVNDTVSALLNAEDERRGEGKTEETALGDLSLIRKNRMALFQQLTCVLPILDNLEASVITKQEHDIVRQKTQMPLQARELIDTILVKGNATAIIFKNSLRAIDSTLYENLFVEKNMKYIYSNRRRFRLVIRGTVAEITRRSNLQSVYGQSSFYRVHSLWSSGSLPGMCLFPEKVPHLQWDNQEDCVHISLINEESSEIIVGHQKMSEQRMNY